MARRTVPCPHCEASLKLPEAGRGKLRCPRCRNFFAVGPEEAAGAEGFSSRNQFGILAAVGGIILAGLLAVFLLNRPAPEAPTKVALVPTASPDRPEPTEKESLPDRTIPPKKEPGKATPPPPPRIVLKDVSPPKKSPDDLAVPGRGKAEPPTAFLLAGQAKGAADLPHLEARGPGRMAVGKVPAHPGVDQVRVDAAIRRGTEFLRNQAGREVLTGARALAGIALLHCGVPADDPLVAKLAETVRGESLRRPLNTYEIATTLWFLDALGDPKDPPLVRHLALRLVASQGHGGGWGYGCHQLSTASQRSLLGLLGAKDIPELLDLPLEDRSDGTAPFTLPADPRELPVLRFRTAGKLAEVPERSHVDNSLTQFAVLALWIARRHGVPVGDSLRLAEARFRFSVSRQGTWSYHWVDRKVRGPIVHVGDQMEDSMTCAGLLALAASLGGRIEADRELSGKLGPDPVLEAACRYVGDRLRTLRWLPADVRASRKALTAASPALMAKGAPAAVDPKVVNDLLRHLGKPGFRLDALIPPAGRDFSLGSLMGARSGGDLYFLWSLERAGVVLNLRTFGASDWYAWGLPFVLDSQDADGGWREMYPGVVDTCFALLFLRRANPAPDLTIVLQDLPFSADAGRREPARPQGVAPGRVIRLGLPLQQQQQ